MHILINLNLDDCFLYLIKFKFSNAVAVSTDVWDAAAAPPQFAVPDIDVAAPTPPAPAAPAPASTGWE